MADQALAFRSRTAWKAATALARSSIQLLLFSTDAKHLQRCGRQSGPVCGVQIKDVVLSWFHNQVATLYAIFQKFSIIHMLLLTFQA